MSQFSLNNLKTRKKIIKISDVITVGELAKRMGVKANDLIKELMSQDMMEIINRLGVEFSPLPFSTRTNLGFNRLYSEMSRVFMGGEPFTT